MAVKDAPWGALKTPKHGKYSKIGWQGKTATPGTIQFSTRLNILAGNSFPSPSSEHMRRWQEKKAPGWCWNPLGIIENPRENEGGGGAHFSSYKSKVCNSDQLSPWEPYGWANILKILAKSCYSAPPGVCRPDGAHLNQHCFPSCRGPPTSTWQLKKL